MRTKYNKRRFRTLIMIIILLLCMSIGYSYLLTTLNIEGTSNIKANTWDVHWENVNVISGSVTGDQVPIAAHVLGDNTQVEFSVILKDPGDYYEFTVDAKNAGSLDAMISIVDGNYYEANGVTPIDLPRYLEYECLYSNGVGIEQNQLLSANSSKTIKIKIKFKEDLDPEQFPTTDKTIVIRESITYIQADENAIETPNSKFEQDSWNDIGSNVSRNNTDYYNVGDTKEVDMGSFGTHTLRIANKSTPEECSTTGFSQTACGFVLEFADIITSNRMNSTNSNLGGWPVSEMREYTIPSIYNAIPETLRNVIMNTRVVSGHGADDSDNFTSIDKLYFLSPHEVWEDDDGNDLDGINRYDKSYNNTRQLDYYKNLGVTTSNYSGANKQRNGLKSWWLRSSPSYKTNTFYDVGVGGNCIHANSDYADGISPAFRIIDTQD